MIVYIIHLFLYSHYLFIHFFVLFIPPLYIRIVTHFFYFFSFLPLIYKGSHAYSLTGRQTVLIPPDFSNHFYSFLPAFRLFSFYLFFTSTLQFILHSILSRSLMKWILFYCIVVFPNAFVYVFIVFTVATVVVVVVVVVAAVFCCCCWLSSTDD